MRGGRPRRRPARRGPPRSHRRPTRAGRTRRSAARATSARASPRARPWPSGGRRRRASAAATRAADQSRCAIEPPIVAAPRDLASQRAECRRGRRAGPSRPTSRRSTSSTPRGGHRRVEVAQARRELEQLRAALPDRAPVDRRRARQEPLVGGVHRRRRASARGRSAFSSATQLVRRATRGAATAAASRAARRRRAGAPRGARDALPSSRTGASSLVAHALDG